MTVVESEKMLHAIEHRLEHMGISHITIQVETSAHKHDHAILGTHKNDKAYHYLHE